MSVGSHYTIYGTDKAILKRALTSMHRFRMTKAPFSRFTYRTNRGTQRKGWTFWRVN